VQSVVEFDLPMAPDLLTINRIFLLYLKHCLLSITLLDMAKLFSHPALIGIACILHFNVKFTIRYILFSVIQTIKDRPADM